MIVVLVVLRLLEFVSPVSDSSAILLQHPLHLRMAEGTSATENVGHNMSRKCVLFRNAAKEDAAGPVLFFFLFCKQVFCTPGLVYLEFYIFLSTCKLVISPKRDSYNISL